MSNELHKHGEGIQDKIKTHVEKIKKNHDVITDNLESTMSEHLEKPGDIILPIINDWVDNVEPVIEKFKSQTDGMFEKIVEPLIDF